MIPVDEKFKKRFPHLVAELGGKGTVQISSVRSSVREGEKAAVDLSGYEPGAVDFLRRCDNEKQALEIIEYLEQKGEISRGHAAELRKQLIEHGLRSFGPKREPGCYERGEL